MNRPPVNLRADPRIPSIAVIEPGTLHGEITAQASKNYTARYLLAAALAEGESIVRNVAASEDAAAMKRCLTAFGAVIEPFAGESALRIRGFGKNPKLISNAPVDPGNAGAVLRLMLGIGALMPEVHFVTSFPDSLGKRPNSDLLMALEELGADSRSSYGCLPIKLMGGKLHGGHVRISGARSSQFLSSLLFLAPLLPDPVEIEVVDGLVSKAPVRQTLEVLKKAGIEVVAADDLLRFRIESQNYRTGEYTINGDWPGSAAILAAAAATGSRVKIRGLFQDNQGERESVDVLKRMGADVRIPQNGASMEISGSLSCGVHFDGDLATDAVLALMGAAAVAPGRTRFHNVSNLRIKECDRISEPIGELRKLGAKCWEGHEVGDSDQDAIIIEGNADGYEGGIETDGRGDHRVIMMLAIVGLRCRKGLRIRGAQHVAKSYPAFFEDLAALGGNVRLEPAA